MTASSKRPSPFHSLPSALEPTGVINHNFVEFSPAKYQKRRSTSTGVNITPTGTKQTHLLYSSTFFGDLNTNAEKYGQNKSLSVGSGPFVIRSFSKNPTRPSRYHEKPNASSFEDVSPSISKHAEIGGKAKTTPRKKKVSEKATKTPKNVAYRGDYHSYPHEVFAQHMDECDPIIFSLTKSWNSKLSKAGIAIESVRLLAATCTERTGEHTFAAKVISAVRRADESLPDELFHLASSLLIQASHELWASQPQISHIGFTYMHVAVWDRM